MLRVAYLCEFPSINGGENSLLSFLRTAQTSVEPVFVSPASGPLAQRLHACTFEHHEFSVFDKRGRRKDADLVSFELTELIGQLNVDLVHANSLSMSRVLGRVANTLDCPAVGHIRDILKVSDKAISDLSQLRLCMTVSDATRNCYVAQGLSATQVVTIYNGIDLKGFRESSFFAEHVSGSTPNQLGVRELLGISPTAIVIGGVGQLGLRKGWEILLDAVEAVIEQKGPSSDLHFVLAGRRHSEKQESIEYEEGLRNRSQNGLLKGRFHLVGYWSFMPQFMNELDLLAHPAHQEPLGRVLLEAAISSTPVIATNVGGTPEIFGDAGALLVPAGDSNAMAEALLATMEDPESAIERAANARHRMETRFSVATHRRLMLRHYQGVLGTNRVL